jgi:hypothetical protein
MKMGLRIDRHEVRTGKVEMGKADSRKQKAEMDFYFPNL